VTINRLNAELPNELRIELEPIGYFSASMPIDENNLNQLRHTMKAHGAHMQKSNANPEDDWWFFLLPKGTTKVKQKHQGAVPRYTVRLPDGFSFTLEQCPLNRDGYFNSPPLIFLDTPEEAETTIAK
jgi:hypothetical protein